MKQKLTLRNYWKDIFIAISALVSGFLLSFFSFGLLWSGISWHIQLIMVFPFLLLSYAVFHWGKGSLSACAFILLGATPLGVLFTRFRDTNDSHLMPILIVLSWIIGMLAGSYLGYLSRDTHIESAKRVTASK